MQKMQTYQLRKFQNGNHKAQIQYKSKVGNQTIPGPRKEPPKQKNAQTN